ncbi:hypothetical protein ABVN80_09465 [Acinetobacter baumannii]
MIEFCRLQRNDEAPQRLHNLGTRNEETRAAANLYEKLKAEIARPAKQEAMTKRYKEAVEWVI